MSSHKNASVWESSDPHVFWGEIAPCNHLVQIYENDEIFLSTLQDFVLSGFRNAESVILIATAEHLEEIDNRLRLAGFDPLTLRLEDQYIPLEAEETLAKFMVGGVPDEDLFFETVAAVISRAKWNGRKTRAFGEMVALLWAQGNNDATMKLENLWNKFCETEAFCLYCAYPKSGFTQDANTSILNIQATHSKVINGWSRPEMEIFYKSIAS